MCSFARIHSERRELGHVELRTIPSRFNFILLPPQNQADRLMAQRLSELRAPTWAD
jgi:hypothetical protein